MCWQKSCACCRNWNSSPHGSRWLILIKLLKIIGCKPTELGIYKGRLKSKKAACTTCFPCITLNSSRYPVLSPCGRGSRLQRIQALQVVWKRMPETSTEGIFQVAFIARQMEQTPQAFFQTTFEPIGRVCAARHARGRLELQEKWRTRACVPHTPHMRAMACSIQPTLHLLLFMMEILWKNQITSNGWA